MIAIKVVDEGERIALYVTDNGIGISAEKLAKFHYKTELEMPFHEIMGANEERRGCRGQEHICLIYANSSFILLGCGRYW
ncbi:MAG: hypothetical protein K0Q73_9087 [Paenibacillus sp.]|nr:hypothetical protein [Paenibacillus sp.]